MPRIKKELNKNIINNIDINNDGKNHINLNKPIKNIYKFTKYLYIISPSSIF